MASLPISLMIAASMAAAADSAATAAPPAITAEDPIVIVGKRDGGTVLIVDFREVALRCAQCRTALEKLDDLAAPYSQARGQMRRDVEALGNSGASHNRHVGVQLSPIVQDSKADRLALIVEGFFKEQRKEVGTKRNAFAQYAAAYLRALAPHVVEIAEAERKRHGASAVVNSRRAKLGKVRKIDITDDVIRQLDARNFTIDLPEPGPKAG